MTIQHPTQHAQFHPERMALIMADTGRGISYRELTDNAARAARVFDRLGCREGSTIALLADNCLEYIEICWGAKDSGLHYACVSTHLNVDDVAYIVDNSDASVLVVSIKQADLVARLRPALADTVRLLVIGGDIDGGDRYETLRDAESSDPLSGRIGGASMLYSSGTTGRPKGVRATLKDAPSTVPPVRHALLASNWGLGPDTVFINPGPFYHAAPLRMMMAVQRMGGTAIGFSRFDAESVLRAIERYRGTHGFFVPTMFVRMLKLPESIRQSIDLSSIRCAIHGAAPCSRPVKEAMLAWWGPVINEVYGGTEGVGHFFIGPEEWMRKKGSVGKPAPGCILRIVDEHGSEVPVNTPGLIYLGNGREFSYYKDDVKTREARGAEGLSTMGDIGYVDDDGYLFLTDRHAHMIISGGVNIYPQEAENVLIEHPQIDDVAVIGIPDEEYGEQVKAVVVPVGVVADTAALAEDIIQFCRARLSSIKCPRSVDFVDTLPRSEAGKLLKRQIRKPYWKDRESTLI